MDTEPCDAILEDVVKKMLSWKQEDCKIMLVGDFNDAVYRGKIAERVADTDLNMTEQILKITDVKIPSSHHHGCTKPSAGSLILLVSNVKPQQSFSVV